MTVQTVKAFNLSSKPDDRLILSGCAFYCACEFNTNIVTGMSVVKGERDMLNKCDRLYNRLIMNMYMHLSKAQFDELRRGHKGSMVYVRQNFIKVYSSVLSHRLRNDGEYPDDFATEYLDPVEDAARKSALEVEIAI